MTEAFTGRETDWGAPGESSKGDVGSSQGGRRRARRKGVLETKQRKSFTRKEGKTPLHPRIQCAEMKGGSPAGMGNSL